MARHRIKYIKFSGEVAVPHISPSGTREVKTYLRGEEDRFVGHFDDTKGYVEISAQHRSVGGTLSPLRQILPMPSVAYLELYEKDELPKWEAEQRAVQAEAMKVPA